MNRDDKYAQHEFLRNETKPRIQKEFRSISMYTRHVGQFFIRREKGSTVDYTPIKIEKAGRCDDWFVLPCYLYEHRHRAQPTIFPIHGEVETKSGNSKLSPKQIEWRDKCLRKHWLWFENRNAEETINNINMELQKRGLVPWNNLNKILLTS